jgi:hypothetical protein
MGRFWNALYSIALGDVDDCPGLIFVSHEELAAGGVNAARGLFAELGLGWTSRSDDELASEPDRGAAKSVDTKLHNFNRDPSTVATSWRSNLAASEVELIESVTEPVRRDLDAARLVLGEPAG